MKLEVGKWYYFDIMGYKSILYVFGENEYEYQVEHFIAQYGGKPEFNREKTYVNKRSSTLKRYKKTNEREIIEIIFT